MKKLKLKKTIRKLHLWLGLTSGIIVFILGITGCLYVFEKELKPIVYADHYIVNDKNKSPLLITDLIKIVQDTLGENVPVSALAIHNSKNRSYMFRSFVNNPVEQKIWYWQGIENRKDIFVNQYTGEVIKIKKSEFEFFRVVMWMHWSLLLYNSIGQPIVGIACLIFVISLITGLILWWPKNKKAAKQRFWFQWKNTTKWKRKNYDLHNIFGYYMMIFALIIALTGLVWAFDWFENSVTWIANGGQTIENKNEQIISDISKNNNQTPIDKIFKQIKYSYPSAESFALYFPEDSLQTLSADILNAGSYDKIFIDFDQFTGEKLKTHTFADNNNGEKVNSLNYDIHVGAILGFPGKILAFFVSLISASLPITGFLIWWGRKNKKSEPIL